jgi:ABC-type glycerol-3-phosphate transport system permease component
MSIPQSRLLTTKASERDQSPTRMRANKWYVEATKYAILIFLSLSFLLPFYWMISSAVKNDAQVYTVPPVIFPIPARWINFVEAWQIDNFNLYV